MPELVTETHNNITLSVQRSTFLCAVQDLITQYPLSDAELLTTSIELTVDDYELVISSIHHEARVECVGSFDGVIVIAARLITAIQETTGESETLELEYHNKLLKLDSLQIPARQLEASLIFPPLRYNEFPVTLANCQLGYECPKSWESLETLPDTRERFCNECAHPVYWCDSDKELAQHIRDKHCVAFVGEAEEPVVGMMGVLDEFNVER